jgi:hypothetical protein
VQQQQTTPGSVVVVAPGWAAVKGTAPGWAAPDWAAAAAAAAAASGWAAMATAAAAAGLGWAVAAAGSDWAAPGSAAGSAHAVQVGLPEQTLWEHAGREALHVAVAHVRVQSAPSVSQATTLVEYVHVWQPAIILLGKHSCPSTHAAEVGEPPSGV